MSVDAIRERGTNNTIECDSVLEQFSIVSKEIRHWIAFALLCSVIGLENSRHFLNQSDWMQN